MNSEAGIVLELQRASSDSSIAVSTLIREALLVARKLKIIDQVPWIHSEYNGYLTMNGNYDTLPKYRFVKSKIECAKTSSNDTEYHDPLLSGRSPSHPNENTADYPCILSIDEIERCLIGKTTGNYVHISCQPDVEKVFIETMKLPSSTVLTKVQASRLYGILDAVRNKIIDWTSELEEKGIIGENFSFSDEQMKGNSADIAEDPPAQTGAGEPPKPSKKRAYTPWPKPAQEAIGQLWVSFRRNGGTREEDCYEEHKAAARLPACIKNIDDFRKCKEAAEKQALIPRLHQKRRKAKGKPCQ